MAIPICIDVTQPDGNCEEEIPSWGGIDWQGSADGEFLQDFSPEQEICSPEDFPLSNPSESIFRPEIDPSESIFEPEQDFTPAEEVIESSEVNSSVELGSDGVKIIGSSKAIKENKKQQLEKLKREMKEKYPQGRPSGAGVLGAYTPGSTGLKVLDYLTEDPSRNLDILLSTTTPVGPMMILTQASDNLGVFGDIAGLIVSPITISVGYFGGSAIDMIRFPFTMNSEHGDPGEFDELNQQIQELEKEITSITDSP